MRFLTTLTALLGIATIAHAHFVFVYVDGTDAKLVFGHKAEPDPNAFPTRAEKTTLTARDATGKETKLTTEKGSGNFYRAKLPEKAAVVFGITEAGVTQRGDDPPLRSFYYPKVIVGDPFAKGMATKATLEILPVRDGDKVRFQVLAEGKPVPEVEVTVGLPGADEDKAQVAKTDKDGLTVSFSEQGRYCVVVRRADDKGGELDGKKYAATRYTATLVCDYAVQPK